MSDSKKQAPRFKTAVGLGYDPAQDGAPRVTVRGEAYLADEVVRLARKHRVPIVEDEHLAAALGRLDAEEEIPPVLFRAVAHILSRLGTLGRGQKRGIETGPSRRTLDR